jgi:TrmH family RNA methyltransferase
MEIISSASNPLIKKVRALHNKKARVDSKTFLVEGIYHVGEVIQSDWDVELILYSPELLVSKFAQDLLKKIKHIKLQPVSANVIKTLTEKENPQGIVAVVKQKELAFEDLGNFNRIVALVAPQDPGNVGSILRTLDAIQADALFLLNGGVELYHPSLVRASMGALFWKPVIQTSFQRFVEWARRKHIQLIGSSAKADTDYRKFTPSASWALVLGNEQKGLTAEEIHACDITLFIPMQGRVSSLNLSVAAAVLLYQLMK